MKFFLASFFLFTSFLLEAKTDIDFWTTDNNVRVYHVESNELPIIDININFDAGSARDPIGKSGLANLTNYLMLLGSGNLDENAISNRFSDVGATLGGGIDPDHAKLTIRSLSDEKAFQQAINAFKSVVNSPKFDSQIFDREKKSTLSFLTQAQTQPDSIGKNAFKKALFANHPYSTPDEGIIENVETITREDVLNFYKNFYTAQNASIVIVGNVNKSQVKEIVENLTGKLPVANNDPIPEVEISAPKELSFDNAAQQAHLFFGMPSMLRKDPDFFPLYVGNYILGGGGFVSRLTGVVREENGLVYSVYSYFMPMHQKGPFQVGLQTKKDQIDDALNLVKEVVGEFIQQGPTEQELKDAKLNLIGGYPLRLDSNKKITEYISMMAVYNYPLDYLETFSKKVNAVSVEQIKDAFQNRLDMSKFSTVIVGKK